MNISDLYNHLKFIDLVYLAIYNSMFFFQCLSFDILLALWPTMASPHSNCIVACWPGVSLHVNCILNIREGRLGSMCPISIGTKSIYLKNIIFCFFARDYHLTYCRHCSQLWQVPSVTVHCCLLAWSQCSC